MKRSRFSTLPAALVATLPLLLACGQVEAEAPTGAAGTLATRGPGDAAPRVALDPGTPLPAAGEVFVAKKEGGRVTALANGAPRVELLGALAKEFGFTLVVGRVQRVAPITFKAVDRPLEAVLAELLEGVSYELGYDVAPPAASAAAAAEGATPPVTGEATPPVAAGAEPPVTGVAEAPAAHRLARLTVGHFQNRMRQLQRERAAEARARGEAPRRRGERRAPTPEEREARLAAAAERREQGLAALESGDAEARAEAVQVLDTEGEDLRRLAALVSEDPDPVVRAAAAGQLASGDSALAVNALLRSLADPDPEVVLAALDALEFAGDESLVPDLEPLLQHPDERVREATSEAIEFLR